MSLVGTLWLMFGMFGVPPGVVSRPDRPVVLTSPLRSPLVL